MLVATSRRGVAVVHTDDCPQLRFIRTAHAPARTTAEANAVEPCGTCQPSMALFYSEVDHERSEAGRYDHRWRGRYVRRPTWDGEVGAFCDSAGNQHQDPDCPAADLSLGLDSGPGWLCPTCIRVPIRYTWQWVANWATRGEQECVACALVLPVDRFPKAKGPDALEVQRTRRCRACRGDD